MGDARKDFCPCAGMNQYFSQLHGNLASWGGVGARLGSFAGHQTKDRKTADYRDLERWALSPGYREASVAYKGRNHRNRKVWK